MAQRNEHSPAQAWSDFTATGSVEDYLRYRAAQNRADAVTGISSPGGAHAVPVTRIARKQPEGERPPGYGAY